MIHRRHTVTDQTLEDIPPASLHSTLPSLPRINTTFTPLHHPFRASLQVPPGRDAQQVLFDTRHTATRMTGMAYNVGDGWQGNKGWAERARMVISGVRRGLDDALRFDKSLSLVWDDRELRTLVLKSTLMNLLSLLLLSLSSVVFSPLLVNPVSSTMQNRTKEIGMWYNILLSWPFFIVCFWVNASWGSAISKRAQTLLHPTYRHQPFSVSTPTRSQPVEDTKKMFKSKISTSVARVLLISDFTLVSRLIGLIPLIGKPGALAYMCIIDAYYFFEWTFLMKQWPLDYRISYMQDRLLYMFGFGLPAVLATSFGPPLVCMSIFALIYPVFVIQALQSRPPTRHSLLLSSTHTISSPLSSLSDRSPTDRRQRLVFPIFFLAKYALDLLGWLEEALNGVSIEPDEGTAQLAHLANYNPPFAMFSPAGPVQWIPVVGLASRNQNLSKPTDFTESRFLNPNSRRSDRLELTIGGLEDLS
ncbi:hypothetical protein L204_103975 [Cryptococcus depauperatus]